MKFVLFLIIHNAVVPVPGTYKDRESCMSGGASSQQLIYRPNDKADPIVKLDAPVWFICTPVER